MHQSSRHQPIWRRFLPVSAAPICFVIALTACQPEPLRPQQESALPAAPSHSHHATKAHLAQAKIPRSALFGDLHVHTRYSFDAFIFGTTFSPDQSYRFAKGEALRHPGGFDMQLRRPLDFYGVTDHGVYLGAIPAMAIQDSPLGDHPMSETVRNVSDETSRRAAFRKVVSHLLGGNDDPSLYADVSKQAWNDIVSSANRHNDPGHFTTFVGYEFTSSGAASANLHRNVIFRNAQVPALPFTAADSRDPEDLWVWMDRQRSQGIDALAIPHNSNGSNGEMFSARSYTGKILNADYAQTRARNEPLIEIVQIKGQSETHPLLSPNDEWADFEIMPYRIGSRLDSAPSGSYAREALGNGLIQQQNSGFNAFKFGFIGSSDTHNASYAGYEDEFWGKSGIREDEPRERGSIPLSTDPSEKPAYGDDYFTRFGAAGLAGVWAEENTRESIFAALRRKETFGTSGPRISVRFFAGLHMPDLNDPAVLKKAYATGVPMGGELSGLGQAVPDFLLWAQADPLGGRLDRVQVIKSYIQNGQRKEHVYDAVCSDGRAVNQTTHRCSATNAKVDLSNCNVSTNSGAIELRTRWQDPDHSPTQAAVYYLRVLENPSCRWSTWDAIRAGYAPREDLQTLIAERAWSSPIWITP
ncbi:DUF3604 domain-containing protein [bacterium]|nr:DUF3604 domain-containing protein [bacterium]